MLFWVCPHRGSVCAPQKPVAEAGPCPPKCIPSRPRGMLSCRGCSPCPSRLPFGGSSKQAASFPCSVSPSGVFRRRYQKEIIWRKKKNPSQHPQQPGTSRGLARDACGAAAPRASHPNTSKSKKILGRAPEFWDWHVQSTGVPAWVGFTRNN